MLKEGFLFWLESSVSEQIIIMICDSQINIFSDEETKGTKMFMKRKITNKLQKTMLQL